VSRSATAIAALALAFAAGLVPAAARAHGRSLSYSSWTLAPDGASVRLRVPLLEMTRIGIDPLADPRAPVQIGQILTSHVRLSSGGEPCVPVGDPRAGAAPEGWALFEWRIHCKDPGPLAITSTLLLDAAPDHLHFARVELPSGEVRERVLSEAEPTWQIGEIAAQPSGPAAAARPVPAVEGTSLAGYVALGIEHILYGADHLAFVLALVLLAASLREVAVLVTGFTLAHTVTLGLAVLGAVRPDPPAIDALIGFSIALVAAEDGWLLGGRGRAVPWVVTLGLLALAALAAFGRGSVPPLALVGLALFSFCHFGLLERAERPARVRAAVAFAFGLIHGFGFAGVLAQLELPPSRLAVALFGFNAGVELGQLGVVAALWPALALLARTHRGRFHRLVAEVGAAGICGLGVFWFLTRALG
jgi:hypothetical protein